jgi:hypothetical protein
MSEPTPQPGKRPGYGTAARAYFSAGWQPLPLPYKQKAPPPTGYTGPNAKLVTIEDVERWTSEHADGNIALHLEPGWIGIDVDHYGDKRGGDTVAAMEALYGPLPPTWCSTARGVGVSSIRLYRIPVGVELVGDCRPWGNGVEIIQARHRYMVVAPSVHPDTDQRYRWYDPAANRWLVPPVAAEVDAWLPDAWIEALTVKAHEPTSKGPTTTTGKPPTPATMGTPDSIAEHINRTHRWGEILTLDGWTYSHNRGEDHHWTRPGKDRGTSAVLHNGGDGPLVVFTTDPVVNVLRTAATMSATGDVASLSLFGYIAATRYNGDRSACASAYRHALNAATATAVTYGSSNTAHRALNAATGHVDPDAGLDDGMPVTLFQDMLVDWSTFWDADHDTAEWLAEPVLAIGRSHVVYAAGGTGKSLFVLWLCARIATGGPGLDGAPLERRHVLYVDFEMTATDLAERLEAFGYGPDDDLSWLHYALLPIIDPADTEAGGRMLVELAKHVDAAIVVVDTYSRAVAGEENSADTVRNRYRHTGLHLKAAGIGLVWISHAGKDGDRGQRGSSAANDDVDVVWHMAPADGGFVLTAKKRRMGWVPADVALRQDTDGPELAYRTALTAVPAGTAAAIAQLDGLGAPLDISMRKAQKMLRDGGFRCRNEVVRAAVRSRARGAKQEAKSVPQNRGTPLTGHTTGHTGAHLPESDISPGQDVISVPGTLGAHPERQVCPSAPHVVGAQSPGPGTGWDEDL